MSYALAQKIRNCRIHPIKEFTENMRADGFGRWSVDVGDTEVPMARAYYDKLCNIVSWDELLEILCTPYVPPADVSKSDLMKRDDLRNRAVRTVERLNGCISHVL